MYTVEHETRITSICEFPNGIAKSMNSAIDKCLNVRVYCTTESFSIFFFVSMFVSLFFLSLCTLALVEMLLYLTGLFCLSCHDSKLECDTTSNTHTITTNLLRKNKANKNDKPFAGSVCFFSLYEFSS